MSAGERREGSVFGNPGPIASDHRLTDVGGITQRRGATRPAPGTPVATAPAVAHGILGAGAGVAGRIIGVAAFRNDQGGNRSRGKDFGCSLRRRWRGRWQGGAGGSTSCPRLGGGAMPAASRTAVAAATGLGGGIGAGTGLAAGVAGASASAILPAGSGTGADCVSPYPRSTPPKMMIAQRRIDPPIAAKLPATRGRHQAA